MTQRGRSKKLQFLRLRLLYMNWFGLKSLFWHFHITTYSVLLFYLCWHKFELFYYYWFNEILNVSLLTPNRISLHEVAWFFYLFEQKLNDSENKLWHWQMKQRRISKCSILYICWWNEKLMWRARLSLSSSRNQISYTIKI